MSEVSFCRFETVKTDISDTCRFHLFSLVVFCRKKFSSAEELINYIVTRATVLLDHVLYTKTKLSPKFEDSFEMFTKSLEFIT